MRYTLFLIYILFVANAFASDSICLNKIYSNNIKTVQLYKQPFELSQPIIQLGSDEKLFLCFDDLADKEVSYKYSFIHCDADWTPSDIMESEYIKGLSNDYVSSFQMSFNTNIQYRHYTLSFPNENIELIQSGNYIICVFDEENPTQSIFTKRFMVCDNKVTIDGLVKRSTIIQDIFYKQEVDFTIDHAGYSISNPYRDLTVVVQQNGRWDNTLHALQPRMMIDNKIYYDYDNGDNTFAGGHEFRSLDIKNIKYKSERIQEIAYDAKGMSHIYLKPDVNNQFKVFESARDINGRFVIHAENSLLQPELEADYATIHFSLPASAPDVMGEIYIMGQLTHWNYLPEARMQYNYEHKAYEGQLVLKQGYYNYQYIYLEKNAEVGDVTRFEGTHSETENEYFIYVYYKPLGYLYDILIGVKVMSSILR